MAVVFLDRDGVINQFPGQGYYVTDLSEFHIFPEALNAIRLLYQGGHKLFVISNQAGVAKGKYSAYKLQRMTDHLLKEVRRTGGHLHGIYYSIEHSHSNADCRKPNIGNIKKALASVGLSLASKEKMYFVGDTVGDIQTGKNAKCTTILSLSGRDNIDVMRRKKVHPDYVCRDLLEAAKIIHNENSHYSRHRRFRP